MYEAKLEFSEGWGGGGGGGGGVIQQIPSNNKVYFCGGYGYFLEPVWVEWSRWVEGEDGAVI